MSATALLTRLYGLGAEVAADGSDLVVKAPPGQLAAADVEELRHRKPALLRLLTGDLCIYCEGAIDWYRPSGVMFGDGTAAHICCYDEAETTRLIAAGKRVVASPDAHADPAELTIRGEWLP